MRIIKKALHEALPGTSVFLECAATTRPHTATCLLDEGTATPCSVDNLGGGSDHPHIDVSDVVLCYCTEKWFTSGPCLREVVRAVCRKKPLIALLEPDTSGVHGGLTEAVCREILRGERILSLSGPGASKTNPDSKTYASRLQDQAEMVAKWAQAWDDSYQPVRLPTAREVEDALFASAPIIWSPLVSARRLARRVGAHDSRALAPGLHPSLRHTLQANCVSLGGDRPKTPLDQAEIVRGQSKRQSGLGKPSAIEC